MSVPRTPKSKSPHRPDGRLQPLWALGVFDPGHLARLRQRCGKGAGAGLAQQCLDRSHLQKQKGAHQP